MLRRLTISGLKRNLLCTWHGACRSDSSTEFGRDVFVALHPRVACWQKPGALR